MTDTIFSRRNWIAIFCSLFLCSCIASFASAANFPRTFEVHYVWGVSNPASVSDYSIHPKATLTLYRNGTVDVFDHATGENYPAVGTWRSRGSNITFVFGSVVYMGTKQNNGSYLGTMSIQGGPNGVWQGRYTN